VPLKLRAGNGFLPDPAELVAAAGPRSRLLFLNYPNNPTGAVATLDDFRAMLGAVREHGTVVANDAAYVDVFFGDERPASLLQAADPGRELVIEFHSLSKTFNMTGWRVGFAVGHADVVGALGRVKQNIDSGVFSAVQATAAHALGSCYDRLLSDVLAPYRARRAMILDALAAAGIEVFETDATFYVWARVPGGGGSLEFCRRVLDEQAVVLTPGVGFGSGGDGWFRISLTAPDQRVREAAARLGRL